MATLYEILANAEDGQAMVMLGREFELTPKETEAAVTALLPAISTGLKQATATPEGLGNLFSMMGQQQRLHAMYDDPDTALGRHGIAAGNDLLSMMFGSPDVSRAIADQAQQFSGIDAGILKKLLPVLAGILVSGLMRGGSGQAAPSGPSTSPAGGGGLGDILGQIFGRGMSPGSSPGTGQQIPIPPTQPIPVPTETTGQQVPGGDLLGHILRELEKGIREGRIKPVIVGGGPIEIPMPGGPSSPAPGDPSQPQMPGGDIFGQILRDIFGGGVGGPVQIPSGRQGPSPGMKDLSDLSKGLGLMGGVGAAVFGDQFETGRNVEQDHLDNIQRVFDRVAALGADRPKRQS